jgi:hypothetical protein
LGKHAVGQDSVPVGVLTLDGASKEPTAAGSKRTLVNKSSEEEGKIHLVEEKVFAALSSEADNDPVKPSGQFLGLIVMSH